MDGNDIRVVKPRQDAGLAVEPFGERGVGGQRLRQQLDGDVAIQPGLAGFIDRTHSALADEFEYFQLRESCGHRRDGRGWLSVGRLAGFGGS
jgi:hypothetical protein